MTAPARRWLRMLAVGLRLLVAAALMAAGAIHLSHLQTFAHAISGYHLLGGGVAVAAVLIAPLELVAGLALASQWLRRGGTLISAALLLVFAVVLLLAWARGIDVRCGCFGALADAQPWWALLRDLGLLAALAAAAWSEACVRSETPGRRESHSTLVVSPQLDLATRMRPGIPADGQLDRPLLAVEHDPAPHQQGRA
jgi:putative oxidoreductase